MALVPPLVELGTQKSPFSENTGAWFWVPVNATEAVSVGSPGPAGTHLAAWSQTAPEQYSLFFRPHPPLPSSGNALSTELLSLGNYEGGKSVPWLGVGYLYLPALCRYTHKPACAWAPREGIGHQKTSSSHMPHFWMVIQKAVPVLPLHLPSEYMVPREESASGQKSVQDY